MVVQPPRLAEWLVRQTTPADMRENILGDLCEEMMLQASGNARKWYWCQALRSVVHWVPSTMLFVIPAYILPLWLLEQLWAFVLSSVPLKEDAVRAWPMLFVNLSVACLLAGLARMPSAALFTASLFLLLATPVILPAEYWCLFLILPAMAGHCTMRKARLT